MNTDAYRQACVSWRDRKKVMTKDVEKMKTEISAEMKKNSSDMEATLGKELMAYLVGTVIDKYP